MATKRARGGRRVRADDGKSSELAKTASKASTRNEAKAKALLARLVELKGGIAKSFYAMGKVLRQLSAPAMYRALGADSFEAVLREHRIMGEEQARKLMRIVEQLDERRALGLGGIEKAFAVVRLGEARKLTPRALAELVDANPDVGGKPLDATSVGAVELAIEEAARKTPLRGAAREAAAAAAHMASRLRERIRALDLRATVSVVSRTRVRVDADAATWRRLLG